MLKKTILAFVLVLFAASTAHAKIGPASYSQKDIECLAKNIYFEARGESETGQIMVAEVVLNRLKNPSFPTSVCGVIYAENAFSWTRQKVSVRDAELYDETKDIAKGVLSGDKELTGTPALFFKAKGAYSRFHNSRQYLGSHGNHDFYK